MKKSKLFYFSCTLLVILIFIAIFAPLIAPYDPLYTDISQKLQLPSKIHILGTDHMGRDVFSRLVYGTRLSLTISGIIIVLTLCVSFPVGIAVGWFGGAWDKLFLWFINVLMAFPSFLLSMALVGILGQGVGNIIIAVTVIEWIYYARILRNMVLSIKQQEYVQAARAIGAPSFYIIRKHILPFVFKPILIAALMNIGNIILMISGFSFLGIGVQPNIAEWGMMLNDAKPYFRRIPGLVLYPGMAIFITVLAFNLLGETFDGKGIKKLWKD
ncbi:ABC transporter permease [Pseudoleptotrichia goodfellowii]|uniref:ABC transporter, permease protein n=1 Tax=Pseudoleptotrichia goodfellowii F0264 TaxID=596323 RepID=D0GLG1_9FUSO|nr:ABC transporter permease subunit [Pseudoleptotrichia goodfellowii]EEY35073.1 ABC transporter, permease protein [Pseudoleptotrichia goodfellowii F0264]